MIIQYLTIFALAYLGFFALSLSIQRHYADVFGRQKVLSRARYITLRLLGWSLLGFSYAVSIASQDWGVGSVMWLGMLMLSGLLVVLITAYLPYLTLKIASFLAVLIVIALCFGQIVSS